MVYSVSQDSLFQHIILYKHLCSQLLVHRCKDKSQLLLYQIHKLALVSICYYSYYNIHHVLLP